MKSSNGNIFCANGHLCGEFTGPWWIPCTKASDADRWCFFDLHPNKLLNKQSWGWWFETPSHHYDVNVMVGLVKSESKLGHHSVYIQCGAIIMRSIYTQIFTKGTASDWYSASVPAIIYAKSYYIEPRYNDTRLYVLALTSVRPSAETMVTTGYPLFADADTGIYPHAASQYHARPKAKRGIAMLSVDKFPYSRKQTRGNEFIPCSNNICDLLKRRSESPLWRHQWRSFVFISHADDVKREIRFHISRLLTNQKRESAQSMV